MMLIAPNRALTPYKRDRKDLIHDDNTSVLGGAHRAHRSFDVYEAWDKPDKAAKWRAKLPDELNSNEQDD